MTKKIFITGAGLGKSLLASLLAKHYADTGVSHKVIVVDSRRDMERLAPSTVDFLICECNDPSVIDQPWQTITVSGGQVIRRPETPGKSGSA